MDGSLWLVGLWTWYKNPKCFSRGAATAMLQCYSALWLLPSGEKYLKWSYCCSSYHINSFFCTTLTLLYFVIRQEQYDWKLHETATRKVNVRMCTMYTWLSDVSACDVIILHFPETSCRAACTDPSICHRIKRAQIYSTQENHRYDGKKTK